MKDHVTYMVTDIFEEQGVLKYVKIAGGVATGGIELFSVYGYYRLSKTLHLRRLRGMAIVFAAYGVDNIWESVSPLIFEEANAGPLRRVVRGIAGEFGLSEDDSDLGYSFIEFSLSVYNSFDARKLSPNANRLVAGIGRKKPGTGRLFNNVSWDYASKWSKMNTNMKIWNLGHTAYKAKLEFYNEKYKFK